MRRPFSAFINLENIKTIKKNAGRKFQKVKYFVIISNLKDNIFISFELDQLIAGKKIKLKRFNQMVTQIIFIIDQLTHSSSLEIGMMGIKTYKGLKDKIFISFELNESIEGKR